MKEKHCEYENLRRSQRKLKTALENNYDVKNKTRSSIRLENGSHNSLQFEGGENSRVQQHNGKNIKKCSEQKSFSRKKKANSNSMVTKSTKLRNCGSHITIKSYKVHGNKNALQHSPKRCSEQKSSEVQNFNQKSKSHRVCSSSNGSKHFKNKPLNKSSVSKSMKQQSIQPLATKKHVTSIDTVSIACSKKIQNFETPSSSSYTRTRFLSKMNENHYKQKNICRLREILLRKSAKNKEVPSLDAKKSLERVCMTNFELEDDDLYEEDSRLAIGTNIFPSTPEIFSDSDMSDLSNFPTPKCNFILTPIPPEKTPKFEDIISPESYKMGRILALELMEKRREWYKITSQTSKKSRSKISRKR